MLSEQPTRPSAEPSQGPLPPGVGRYCWLQMLPLWCPKSSNRPPEPPPPGGLPVPCPTQHAALPPGEAPRPVDPSPEPPPSLRLKSLRTIQGVVQGADRFVGYVELHGGGWT